ncbi:MULTISPECIES: hypothetical protein [unclassified Mesorhizobium]|uniref:hypothetical protein n=1 Tax=unclassified Mesorhizobium TaxID=325217 RepID=UPI000FD8E045|nr:MULTISPECIES: hypothetical protein [unclassified Mesorhizobium]TGS09450.1 hypothetical protein EN852_030745 [Mesorhizobium sp. M2E.F.Ca.ET.209.01.1.1]TGT68328.1 hypothetical protein EN809_027955 [Mesorhizobium sp. M2E.F.Ca.ET.166.01.1.1]TGW01329.1 hypothetical protein EN797_013265 [Mesorhizobium sp. M2E.F.Ca.ET.154.01.1.1]
MIAVFIRIALRYSAGMLVARGLLGADDASAFSADPDIQMALETGLGLVIAGVAEWWHLLARRFGWEH